MSMNFGSDTAADMARGLLHKSAGPLISGDFESFTARSHLPQSFSTPSGIRILQTRAELGAFFDDLVEYYQLQGAKLVNSKLLQADFLNEGSAVSIHENRLIGRSGVLLPPVRTFSVMRKCDQRWAVSHCEHSSADHLDFYRVFMGKASVAV